MEENIPKNLVRIFVKKEKDVIIHLIVMDGVLVEDVVFVKIFLTMIVILVVKIKDKEGIVVVILVVEAKGVHVVGAKVVGVAVEKEKDVAGKVKAKEKDVENVMEKAKEKVVV